MRSGFTGILFILFALLAGTLSVSGQQDGEPPLERPKPSRRPPMEFEPRVNLGDPVDEDCTVRCHIDFPFDTGQRFSHMTHGPRRGFDCTRCHSEDPLPLETHGKLVLAPGDCGKCHHDPGRFDSCDICHKPVYFQMEYKGIPFNHYKHAYAECAIGCSLCHKELSLPKNRREAFSCFTCHHVENPPLDCRVCHQDAFELKYSERFDGFRHKIHAESRHMTKRCWTCHDKETMAPPENMDCRGCHHPSKQSPNRDCRICHKRIENRRIERINPKFLHEPHIRKGFPCTRCHALDIERTAAQGLDCQGCHHQHKGGCRKCHDHKIYFIRWYDHIPASPELPFLHAVHETDDNCNLCHLSGRSIRKGFEALNCADCHHYSGHSPSCDFCHPEIERTRAGMLPTGKMGSPEAMYGIVSCEDCHGYDPSSYRGLADGYGSCTLCHPEEYMALNEELRNVLNDVMNRFKVRCDEPSKVMSFRQALHNTGMMIEYFRAAREETAGSKDTSLGKDESDDEGNSENSEDKGNHEDALQGER